MKSKILRNVRREIKTVLADDDLITAAHLSYNDLEFDLDAIVSEYLPSCADDETFDLTLEHAVTIAEAEFDRIITRLTIAHKTIESAFQP